MSLKLVPDDPTPLEKLLLDASRAEVPSDDHKARLRAALGISVPLSGPFAAPAPTAANVPQSAAASLTPPAAVAAKSWVLAKVAVGVGVAAVAGALWLTSEPEAAAPVPQRAVAATPVKPTVEPLAASPATEPQISPLPPVEERAETRRSRPAPAAALAAEDLSEQIRLIEAARAGVASRDSRAALSALDSYASKFPRGSFGQEAAVLRIRAVDQSGDSARATAMAKAFVARFPNSPHVARLKPIAERSASR